MANIHEKRKRSIKRLNKHIVEVKAREFIENYKRILRQYARGESWCLVKDTSTVKTMARCLNYRGITFTMTHSAASGNVKVFFCQKATERYLKENPFYFNVLKADTRIYDLIATNDPYIRTKYRTTVENGEYKYGIIV